VRIARPVPVAGTVPSGRSVCLRPLCRSVLLRRQAIPGRPARLAGIVTTGLVIRTWLIIRTRLVVRPWLVGRTRRIGPVWLVVRAWLNRRCWLGRPEASWRTEPGRRPVGACGSVRIGLCLRLSAALVPFVSLGSCQRRVGSRLAAGRFRF
jgi:hypothetical protein